MVSPKIKYNGMKIEKTLSHILHVTSCVVVVLEPRTAIIINGQRIADRRFDTAGELSVFLKCWRMLEGIDSTELDIMVFETDRATRA